MKVIKATEYSDIARTALRVCSNPDDPEWVHIVGEQRLGADGVLMTADDGSPVLITSANIESDCTEETCHNCRYNWKVREFIFDGNARFYINDSGQTVAKTIAQYVDDIKQVLADESSSSAAQSDWVGTEF